MRTYEVLEKAKDLLSDPDKWTQQAYARDADGETVMVHDESAVRWCVLGAVGKVVPDHDNSRARMRAADILNESSLELHNCLSATGVNDGSSHRVVLAMLDHATEKAKELDV